MLPPSLPGDRPRTPRELRSYRVVVSVLFVLALAALAAQYTRHALFSPGRTDTLWGIVVGVLVAGIGFDRWVAARVRRGPP